MTNLTPNKIISNYHSKEFDLNTTIHLLISLISENENGQLRAEAINSLARFGSKNNYKIKVFEILENSFISDENHLVRKASIKNLVRLFPEKCSAPLKWAIKHEKSAIVFKTIIDLIKNIDDSKRKVLNEAIAERFGVISKEVSFFSDLINILVESLKESNYDDANFEDLFAKTDSLKGLKDWLIYGESPILYAVQNERVIALNLRCPVWRLDELPKSLRMLSKLRWLNLESSGLKVVPDWLGKFIDLSYLNLYNCNLKTLPKSIFELSRRNFTQKYVSKGVNIHDAAVLGIFEMLVGRKLKNIKLIRDGEEKRHYKLNGKGFIISLDISFDGSSLYCLPFIPEQISLLKHLEKLFIFKTSIDKLPKCIGDLSNLKRLYISYTTLEKIPESIGNLALLEELSLYNNKIREISDTIGKLASLKNLILDDNEIWKIPDSIGNLRNLKTLGLSGNGLRKIPKSIGNLESLRYLFLEYNRIDKFPKSIKNLKNLERFEIGKLSKIPKWLKSLTSLELLEKRRELRFIRKFIEKGINRNEAAVLGFIKSLIGREFKDIVFKEDFMEEIKSGSFSMTDNNGCYKTNEKGHVIVLYISLFDVSIPIPEQIRRLKHLEELHILFAWMKNLPDWIGSLSHLRNLSITDTDSIEIIPASIANLKDLRVLDLSGNNLSEIPESIGNLTNLKQLNLSRNKFKEVPKFIKKLKNLEIIKF
jgi:Leucine-rich repeat (LRR) protein